MVVTFRVFQLSDKKLELCDLYKELRDSRGFSEDCEKSILHRLICLLIESTANTDPEVKKQRNYFKCITRLSVHVLCHHS